MQLDLTDIQTRNQMHPHKGNAIPAGSYVGYFFPILLQGTAKMQKYIQEISKKLHFKICHYVMPPPGDVIE